MIILVAYKYWALTISWVLRALHKLNCLILKQHSEVGIIPIATLQMRKLAPRAIKASAQVYAASKSVTELEFNVRQCAPEPVPLTLVPHCCENTEHKLLNLPMAVRPHAVDSGRSVWNTSQGLDMKSHLEKQVSNIIVKVFLQIKYVINLKATQMKKISICTVWMGKRKQIAKRKDNAFLKKEIKLTATK